MEDLGVSCIPEKHNEMGPSGTTDNDMNSKSAGSQQWQDTQNKMINAIIWTNQHELRPPRMWSSSAGLAVIFR